MLSVPSLRREGGGGGGGGIVCFFVCFPFFALNVQGFHLIDLSISFSSFPLIDLKDGQWHHACLMWDQTNTLTSAYYEGVHAISFARSYRQGKTDSLDSEERRAEHLGRMTR